MEALSNDVLSEIFLRLRARNNVTLVCRKWYELDRILRWELRTGEGLYPPESALAALCTRFCNLTTVDISYLGWASNMGKQVDDASLRTLSVSCTNLTDLSLNFCSFITDVGMTNLTLCPRLKAIRLNFTPCVSGRGLLSLVSGCVSLSLLHINRLMNVRVVEWLGFIGAHRRLESLAIRNCKGVGEMELAKLGRRGWENLREFFFEIDVHHRPSGDFFGHNGRGAQKILGWKSPDLEEVNFCPRLETLSLTNCLSSTDTGMAWLLSQCPSLLEVRVDTCAGIEDKDLLLLAQNSLNISSISLRVPCHVATPMPPVTDTALLGIANHCHLLETFILSFGDGDHFPAFTETGIVAILNCCRRLKVLCLDRTRYFFTDATMQAVCRSESLQVLELTQCHEVTDARISTVAIGKPNLRSISLVSCPLLTDAWLSVFKASGRTLSYLRVEDCPGISQHGVIGAAQVVCYKSISSR